MVGGGGCRGRLGISLRPADPRIPGKRGLGEAAASQPTWSLALNPGTPAAVAANVPGQLPAVCCCGGQCRARSVQCRARGVSS